MEPQELVKQQVLQSLEQAKNNDDVQKAQDEAKRTAIITAIGRALSTAANAKAQSRGGAALDLSPYDALDASGRQGVQDAHSAQNQKVSDIIQANQLRQSFGAEDRANQELGIKKSESDRKVKNDATDSEFKKAQLDLLKNKLAEDTSIKQQNIELKSQQQSNGISEAEKAFEKTSAQDLANWKSQGGAKAADLSINRLESIRDKLRSSEGQSLSGGFVNRASSLFGESGKNIRELVNPQTTSTSQEIGSAALPGMKAMFPGQTSDRELKTFMELSFDPRLSPEENAKKLDGQINVLKAKRDSFVSKEEQLGKTGSLLPQDATATPEPGSDIDSQIQALEKELGIRK